MIVIPNLINLQRGSPDTSHRWQQVAHQTHLHIFIIIYLR
jgi:hypothetical protein